ncbi:MAG TPA: hypothetical protein VG055_12835 [Planctomycetaceae bacterium]|jgi:hypothetical protein|nr:hypothetical protein [Planctomycetaceae bacterium]
MSDEPNKRSHPVRLAVSMVIGVFVGSIFVQMALPWTAVICILGGALAGLAVELFRRAEERTEPKNRRSSDDGMKRI